MSRLLAAWGALLPNVDDPQKKEELAASRSKQRARDASCTSGVVGFLAGMALLVCVVGFLEVDFATPLARAAAMFEPLMILIWLVLFFNVSSRYWLYLCVIVHVWATVNGVALVVMMMLDGCAVPSASHTMPEQVGVFVLAERVCRYTRVGLYPSWLSIIVLIINCSMVTMDRLSFRTNLAVLLTEYVLYVAAMWGMLDGVSSPRYMGPADTSRAACECTCTSAARCQC